MEEVFRKTAAKIAKISGSVWAFTFAVGIILLWILSGPLFDYSDTWQLAINTTTTIVTFLMVFLIQNTQNRDSRAMHLKLDELVRAVKGASPKLLDIEDLPNEELEAMTAKFKSLNERYILELDRRQRRRSKQAREDRAKGKNQVHKKAT